MRPRIKSEPALLNDRAVDRIGQRFGHLVVIARDGTRRVSDNSYPTWLCRCDCGSEVIATGHCLQIGNCKSCGCLRLKGTSREKALKALIGRYKREARVRGLIWAIPDSKFFELIAQDCYYCGSKPTAITRVPSLNAEAVYMGIDRVDNDDGYLVSNVVSCCKICNRAKNNMALADFVLWVDQVHTRIVMGFK